ENQLQPFEVNPNVLVNAQINTLALQTFSTGVEGIRALLNSKGQIRLSLKNLDQITIPKEKTKA
ncbi:MAG: hypothetical protein AAF985_24195, partial [Bacteroidota bacterium]